MKLNCSVLSEERPQFYQSVKNDLNILVQRAAFSTNTLAAHMLLVVYEMGQGLFPAAYLSLGSISQIFFALGIHDRKKATQLLPRPGDFLTLSSWVI